MRDLDDHFERLKWSLGQIDLLEAEVTKYTDSDPLEVYWQMGLERLNPSRIYKTRVREPVPKSIQIHAGTIINEMRAILDSLVVTLAARNGHLDSNDTYFPTAKSANGFRDPRVQRKFRRLSDADKQTITNLQPWLGGNDVLYALHSSDIIRKHQRLILISGDVGSTRLGSEGGWVLEGGKLDFIRAGPGHPIGEPIARLALNYHIEIKHGAVVAFSEPDLIKSKPVIETLHDFAGLVEVVLRQFS